MDKLLDRYRNLTPGQQKASLFAVAAGLVFDILVIRHIVTSDSTRFLPKAGWVGATLLSTPGGGIAYLKYGRR